jgi:hypothetical protein
MRFGPEDMTPPAGQELAERVKVRIVVREIERYERVVDMPRGMFEQNKNRLAEASAISPGREAGIALLMFEQFITDTDDNYSELTEVEAFELTDLGEDEDLIVDPDSMEQGDV